MNLSRHLIRHALLAATLAITVTSQAQIYVANSGAGKIGKYNLDGTPINTNLITGLSFPQEVVISGNRLFVLSRPSNSSSDLIGVYNLDGSPVNASLINTFSNGTGLAVEGSSIYVGSNGLNNPNYGAVVKYSTSGALVNAFFIPWGLGNGNGFARGMAVSGGNLFVVIGVNDSQVAKYLLDGTLVNAGLLVSNPLVGPYQIAVSGTDMFVTEPNPSQAVFRYTTSGVLVSQFTAQFPNGGIAISGGNLYVANGPQGLVGKYNLDGTLVNGSLISGLTHPQGIAIEGNGLTAQENWRQTYFGITTNSGDAADLFDFDKDGLVNLIEFAFGLNPKQGSAGQLPQGQVIGSNFVVSFSQPAGVSGITYGAEWSTTLTGTWNPITDTGTLPQHTFSVPIGSSTSLFMRLKVTSP